MIHPNEEDLVDAYYQGCGPELQTHLDECAGCSRLYQAIFETLEAAHHLQVPERSAFYGAEVWRRLLPGLPHPKARTTGRPLILLAAASLLAVVFLAGMLTEHKRIVPASGGPADRVLYLALSEHLEQAQLALTQLAHTSASSAAASDDDRARARSLLLRNRILRRKAMQARDFTDAAVLDDLERVLVEVSNSDSSLQALRHRMDAANLLFRVRISGSDARLKGERL